MFKSYCILTNKWHHKCESLTAYNGLESVQMIHKAVGISDKICWVVFKHQTWLGDVLLNNSLRWKHKLLLYSWKFFPNSARFHWLLRGHMKSNNETVSWQNLSVGNISKNLWRQRVTVHCCPRMLTDDRRLQRGLVNFQLQIFHLHNRSLENWSLEKQN